MDVEGACVEGHARAREDGLSANVVQALLALSAGIVLVEKALIGAFSAIMFALVVVGMFGRYAGHAIYWIDEAAVYSMVAMSFVGASLVTRLKQEFAITLVLEYLPAQLAWLLRLVIAAIGFGFAGIIVFLSWRMWDLITLAQMSFDIGRFSLATFNYIYTETTTTLGLPKFLFLLILPLYAIFLLVHTTANVVEALRKPELSAAPEQPVTVG